MGGVPGNSLAFHDAYRGCNGDHPPTGRPRELKTKNWKQYEYSRAWVPIEVPKGEEVGSSIIERPPNKDR